MLIFFGIISDCEVVQIVDTATIIYQDKKLSITNLVHNIQYITNTQFEIENNKYIFKNLSLTEYNFINFISVTELKKNIRLSVTFSYSRFESKSDNFTLCTRERSIKDCHTAIIKLFRSITAKPLKYEDLEVYAIDISNQLQVENIRNYYNTLDLIYRAFKRNEPNGRLYFDVDRDKRKQLDGLDFRERGKKRREATTYFKIYSKRKELEDTGKEVQGRGTALRGELTLKGFQLKKWGLSTLEGINKKNLERVLKETLAETLIPLLNDEINDSLDKIKKAIKGTKNIKQNILMYDYLIFDIKLLDIILIPDVLGKSIRQCQYHKKAIIELLQENSIKGEVKKTYEKNFERLQKLLKKIVKADVKIDLKGEDKLIWQSQNSRKRDSQ